jgi:streptogrisin D
MIGPPFLKLSMRKLELKIPGFGVGAGVATGLAAAAVVAAGETPGAGDSKVTGTEAPGLAIGDMPGMAGDIAGIAGDIAGAAGDVMDDGVVIGGNEEAGDSIGGGDIAGGGD